MKPDDELKQAINQRLLTVIDPETGIDVVRMKLVINLTASEQGDVSYQFRPSSPLCPIAVPLVISILEAVQEVKGVRYQTIEVIDYIKADELNTILMSILPKRKQEK